MGLINESEYGGYRAKNFAVLMFAEKPDKFIPYAHVEIIREVVGTDKMEAKVFDGPIWIQAKQVSRYFKDNLMASYTIRNSETIEHRMGTDGKGVTTLVGFYGCPLKCKYCANDYCHQTGTIRADYTSEELLKVLSIDEEKLASMDEMEEIDVEIIEGKNPVVKVKMICADTVQDEETICRDIEESVKKFLPDYVCEIWLAVNEK